MHITDPGIDAYLGRLAVSADPVLREMEKLAKERSFPIVGPQVGRLLFALARAAGTRRVLELGSGFGYSAIWFARAVGDGGIVVLTEDSKEHAAAAAGFLERAGLGARVRIEVGDALEIAAREAVSYDLIFNDVEKEDYPKVLPIAERLLRPGGLFVSDNVLWGGEVLRPTRADAAAKGILRFTKALLASRSFATAIVPLRDGVAISVRV